jgi:large subunit ribosomal protein L18
MRIDKKNQLLKLRRWRIRKKVKGTRDCPRMSVRFTNQNIYIQFIDDEARVTLAATSTLSKSIPNREQLKANAKGAAVLGGFAAEAAKSKGIEKVVFDRSGSQYHGKVKALADAARKGGLKF